MDARRVGLVLLLVTLLAPRVAAAPAGVPLDAATMKAALHTDSREAGDFIERVLAMVDRGTLPASLVDTTFQWARKKPTLRFQYFKHALRARAKQIGVAL